MTPRDPVLVVDTSVAIKWIVEEDDSELALSLREADLAAPALFRIEAANVLRSLVARQQIPAPQARGLYALLQTAPVTIVDQDDALERRALELALELRHPVYDCLYLALAERIGGRLVTADRRFVRALTGTGHEGRVLPLSAFARLGD